MAVAILLLFTWIFVSGSRFFLHLGYDFTSLTVCHLQLIWVGARSLGPAPRCVLLYVFGRCMALHVQDNICNLSGNAESFISQLRRKPCFCFSFPR